MGFIPDDWLQGLDYSTLEKVPGSYVSDDFQQREDDIVWKVKVGEDWVYLYLLIEFQSSVDKYMALRMMVYIGLLYQDLIKRGDVLWQMAVYHRYYLSYFIMVASAGHRLPMLPI